MPPTTSLSRADANALRIRAQGFPPPRSRPVPRALTDHGWVRTLGGTEAYIALWARCPGMTRAKLDAAVRSGAVRVSPSVRGCIYVVPDEDRDLALQIARELSATRDERDAKKAGIRPGELAKLGRHVLAALQQHGPQSTDELRRALPANAIRSLGDAGKKVGVSSPLPPALRQLEFAGRIERTPIDGRLDSERYRWQPAARDCASRDPADVRRELAARFFRAAGVASVDAFAAWAGIGKRDAAAAAASLGLSEVQVEGEQGLQLAAATRGAADRAAATEACALLPFADNLTALQDGLARFVEPEFHTLRLPGWGSKKEVPLSDSANAALRPVLAGGGIRGFWEYDPDERCVVLGLFDDVAKPARTQLTDLADSLTKLLRDGIGHGRSYSLDTDDELRRRLAVVRKLDRSARTKRR